MKVRVADRLEDEPPLDAEVGRVGGARHRHAEHLPREERRSAVPMLRCATPSTSPPFLRWQHLAALRRAQRRREQRGGLACHQRAPRDASSRCIG